MQEFLDRANFSPGKIDGRYNDITRKALALYRESRGEQPQTPPPQPKAKSNAAPDVTGLDLASVDSVFIPYTVTEADLQSIGTLPKEAAQQAKLKFLPYRDAADAHRPSMRWKINLVRKPELRSKLEAHPRASS